MKKYWRIVLAHFVLTFLVFFSPQLVLANACNCFDYTTGQPRTNETCVDTPTQRDCENRSVNHQYSGTLCTYSTANSCTTSVICGPTNEECSKTALTCFSDADCHTQQPSGGVKCSGGFCYFDKIAKDSYAENQGIIGGSCNCFSYLQTEATCFDVKDETVCKNKNKSTNNYTGNISCTYTRGLHCDGTVRCGPMRAVCEKSDQKCTDSAGCKKLASDIAGNELGNTLCLNGICYFDADAKAAYEKSHVSVLGIQRDLQIKKPLLEISLPGLSFSNVSDTLDNEGYIHLPYIGEYISAIYKFGMAMGSIIAVTLLIATGARILVSGGGEEKVAGYKRIGEIVIGLFIMWGSYAILYNINPDLVNFKILKILYIKPEPLPAFDQGGVPTQNLHPQAPTFTGYDEIFKRYGNCLEVDWPVLKAAAFVESGFQTDVKNSLGFTGLFQTKENFCRDALRRFHADENCSKLADPEVSTMVGASMMLKSIELIKKSCTNVDNPTLLSLIYIGHQSGSGVLRDVLTALKKQCTVNTLQNTLVTVWNSDTYKKLPQPPRTPDIVAAEAYNGGQKLVKYAEMYSAKPLYVKTVDSTKCPLDNQTLRFVTQSVTK